MTDKPAGDTLDATPPNGLAHLLETSSVAKVMEILVVLGGGIAVMFAVMPFVGDGPVQVFIPIALGVLTQMALVWASLVVRGQPFSHLGLTFTGVTPRKFGRAFVLSILTFVVVLIFYVAPVIVVLNIWGMPEEADLEGYNYLSGNLPMLLVSLVSVWITASFGEELIYRGFLINRVAELVGGSGRGAWIAGVLVSSVLFGLAHYAWGPFGMVQTGAMAIALGGAYLLFGRNLWITILTHFYMDTIMLVQQYFM